MKRVLSIVLSLLLLVTMIPLGGVMSVHANATTMDNGSNSTINVGDCITLGTYNGEPIVWRCVGIDENGPLMLSDKILCLKAFDANGADSEYHSDGWGYIRKKYGSNCWSDSNLRQWLNSNETKVDWSHCPPSAERIEGGYNAYDNEPGFLNSFTSQELSLVKTVMQRSYVNSWETERTGYCDGGTKELNYWPSSTYVDYTNYYYQNVTDRFFLLNPSQADMVYQYSEDYLFKAYPTQTAITNSDYSNEALSTDLPWQYWFGIPRNEGASYECQTIADGTTCNIAVGAGGCYNGTIGVRPAFYLNVDNYYEDIKREDGFNFYLNHPSNYINVNSTVDLHIGYYLNNTLDSSLEDYIYTISNSDVISVTDNGWSTKYGQKLKVTAKQTGSSTITVTNPNTSESSSLEIYVTGNESGWNFYNIPKMTIKAGKTTNFYNFNGLVVDDFSYSEHQNADGNTDYYIVSMNVYNSNNLYGAVTSYDRYGEIYEYVILDKMDSHDSSFVSSCKSLYYSFGDCYYLIKNSKFYSGKSITKETPVTLKVPVGGHLSISNNSKYSDIVCAANTIGLIFDATMLTYDFATMNVDEDLLVDKKVVIKEILEDLAESQSLKLIKEKVREFLGSGSNMNTFSFSTILGLNTELKQGIDFDIKNAISMVVDNSLSVVETVVKKVLPTGGIINLMYTFNDGCNLTTFLHMYLSSFDCSTAINIYAPSDSSKYQSNGISIDTQDDMSETVVHAYIVADTGSAGINKNTFADESTYYSKKYQTYNITLYKNGSETQPSSTVTVRIPIPNGFNKLNRSALKVYRNNDDGTLTNMNAHVEGDYMVFETDHFSYYSIVDESVPSIAEDLKFSGASLTLQDDLTINYKVNKSVFDASGFTNPYVEFIMNENKTVITKYEVIDDKYVFRFADIAPDLLNDTIYATLYAEKEGMTYHSVSREYSVAEYCYSMLDLYAADQYAELRTLLVDLLNYGTASQTYTGYRTDALVNASLTAAQLQWGTSEETALDTVLDTAYKTVENPTAKWKGAGLNLQESISIRLKFTAENVEDLRVVVESGISKWTIFSDKFVEEDGVYYVYFTGMDAGQMRQSVHLTICDGDTPVSNTVCYSIGSYAYEKQNSTIAGLPELVKAMMKYGDSAYAYVH